MPAKQLSFHATAWHLYRHLKNSEPKISRAIRDTVLDIVRLPYSHAALSVEGYPFHRVRRVGRTDFQIVYQIKDEGIVIVGIFDDAFDPLFNSPQLSSTPTKSSEATLEFAPANDPKQSSISEIRAASQESVVISLFGGPIAEDLGDSAETALSTTYDSFVSGLRRVTDE